MNDDNQNQHEIIGDNENQMKLQHGSKIELDDQPKPHQNRKKLKSHKNSSQNDPCPIDSLSESEATSPENQESLLSRFEVDLLPKTNSF